MNIIGIFFVLSWYFGSWRNFVESANWVDDLTRFIVESPHYRQVRLMTRLDDTESLENPSLEKLIVGIMQEMPLLRTNFDGNFTLPINSVPDEKDPDRTPIDTSATLFLLVIDSPNGLPVPMTKRFIRAVSKMATYHYSPKYLMVSFSENRSDSLEEVLQYAWSRKVLDFTIIEATQPDVSQYLLAPKSSAVLPIIHQLNPFKKEYLRENWNKNTINLFPNKFDNLYGYPLRIKAVNNPPFTVAEFNDRDEPIKIGGAHLRLIKTFIKELNASAKYFRPTLKSTSSDVLRKSYVLADSLKIDITSSGSPIFSTSWNDTLRTVPILVDKYCAVVPIVRKSETPISTDFFLVQFMSFILVLIFFTTARLLRFKSASWTMFNIGCVLFSVVTTQQPRPTVERIAFACLLIISAIFSSTIYTAITSISLQKNSEIEFKTIEDLAESGLVPYLHPFQLERTEELFEDIWKDYEKVSVPLFNTLDCVDIAVKHKNVTCFMERIKSKFVVDVTKYQGLPILKIAHPCFWTDSYGFAIGKRWPYRSKFDKMISRLHSTGIIEKFFQDDIRKANQFNDDLHDYAQTTDSENMAALDRELLIIAIVGYSASIVVFIVEIIYHRIIMRRKSKLYPGKRAPLRSTRNKPILRLHNV